MSQEFDEVERLYPTYQDHTLMEEDEIEERERTEEDDDDEEERERMRRRKQAEDSVPTCAESLKKQWQAWSLRVRFGMFRAERRIKRRVQSLI